MEMENLCLIPLFDVDKYELFIIDYIALAKKNSYFYKIKTEEITFVQNEKLFLLFKQR